MKHFNLKAYYRILWREAADQYALCIGIFALLVLMQTSLTTMEAFNLISPPNVGFGFAMALFMTAIYAASSASLLMVTEIDNGTFTLHRTQPLNSLTYLSGKLSWTALSSLVLGIACWLETAAWQGGFPGSQDTSMAFGVCGVAIVEGMAYGVIASMMFKGPLRAVVAGIALTSFGAWFVMAATFLATGSNQALVQTLYYNAAWPRLVVAILVIAANFPLTRVWFRTGKPLRPIRLPDFLQSRSQTAEAIASTSTPDAWSAIEQPQLGRKRRLLWQAWRQIRTPARIYWGLCAVTMLGAGILYYMVTHWVHGGHNPHNISDAQLSFFTLAVFLILVFSSLLTGYTFGPDQKSRFMQLARDGVSPWEIWTSRMAAITLVLLPPMLVITPVFVWLSGNCDDWLMLKPMATYLVLLIYISIIAIGQACSMISRSRIIALLAAPVMVGCFMFWLFFGVFFLGLGWELGAVPILVALLIATRLLTGTRLRQDNSWRAMRIPMLLIVTTVVFTYQAFAYHRTHEVQPYDSPNNFYLSTIDMADIDSWPERWSKKSDTDFRQDEWGDISMQSTRKWIEQTLVLDDDDTFKRRRSGSAFYDPWRYNDSHSRGSAARDYEQMLDQEIALNRTLVDVVRDHDVPNDRLRVCIDLFQQQRSIWQSHAAWLNQSYRQDLYWLMKGPIEEPYLGYHTKPIPWQCRWIPCERERAIQVLDRIHRIAVERTLEYEDAVINDRRLPSHSPRRNIFVYGRDIIDHDLTRPAYYQHTGGVVSYGILRDSHLIQNLHNPWLHDDDPLYNAEADRRATIIFLALKMYHNDNGELPETLDLLVEDGYLDKLPVVPICLQPLYYEPEVTEDIRYSFDEEAVARNPIRLNGYGQMVQHVDEKDLAVESREPVPPFLFYPSGEWVNGYSPDKYRGASRSDLLRNRQGVFIDLDFVE